MRGHGARRGGAHDARPRRGGRGGRRARAGRQAGAGRAGEPWRQRRREARPAPPRTRAELSGASDGPGGRWLACAPRAPLRPPGPCDHARAPGAVATRLGPRAQHSTPRAARKRPRGAPPATRALCSMSMHCSCCCSPKPRPAPSATLAAMAPSSPPVPTRGPRAAAVRARADPHSHTHTNKRQGRAGAERGHAPAQHTAPPSSRPGVRTPQFVPIPRFPAPRSPKAHT